MLKLFHEATAGRLTLIGAGGIASGADAYAKIRAGATLVQLYSAMVYEGPPLIRRIKEELVAEVEDVIRSLLSEGIMMVLVTHAIGIAREISNRIAYVSEGRIAEIGSPTEVLDRPQDPTLTEFLRRIR